VAGPIRYYRILLKLYPARFREEFAAPLERQFSDEYRETHGAGQRAIFWLRTLADWAVSVPAEMARELRQDVRYAVRVYRRRALVTTLALSALALAIGATTGVFSVLNAVLFRGLPFRDTARLAEVQGVEVDEDNGRAAFYGWRNGNAYLEDAAAYAAAAGYTEMNLSVDAGSRRVSVAETSANFFSMLGTEVRFGRAFAPDEDLEDKDAVAVIGYGLWQECFGGDPRVLGSTIRLNRAPVTVIGVAPPAFDYPERTAVWTPTIFHKKRLPKFIAFPGNVIGRVKAELTLALAGRMYEAEMRRLHPESLKGPERYHARLIPLRDSLAGPVRQASLVLLGAVALVLLIACANVAQLLLSRLAERRQELMVRAALGASRARLVQQLITECSLLTLAATAAGLGVAKWAARLVSLAQPATLSIQQYTILDWRVLAFATGTALLTGLLFGVLPASLMGRMLPAGDVVHSQPGLRSSGAGRMRTVLVAVQAALAVVLVAGSVSMGRSFLKLLGIDLGYRTGHVVTLNVSLIGTSHEGQAAWRQYYGDALERLRAVPGVESAGATSLLPLMRGLSESARFTLDDRHVDDVGVREASPDFFRSIGSALVAGREFTAADQQTSEQLVIVNEDFARALGRGDLVGRKISGYRGKAYTVVGVVHTVRQAGPGYGIGPDVYRDMDQQPRSWATFTAKVRGDAERYLALCRDAVQAVDPQVPVYDVKTLDQRLSENLARPRLYTSAVLFLGVFALLLAVVGTYGVASYSITQRSHEIGVRIAVGASPRGLRGMLLRQSMLPVACGALAGVAGAGALGRYLQNLMTHADPTGPWTCAVAAAALAATAALAVWTATGRIVRMDPTAALRAE
jgi:putative ABC transport system permease protein